MIGLILSLSLTLAPPSENPTVVRRFALLVGSNDGGAGRQTLRYAIADAANVGSVLRTLGGVHREDLLVVDEPDVAGFHLAFQKLNAKIQGAESRANRVEVIFYYSGHSDDTGLLLQGKRVSYRDIRAMLEQVPADVRIAVLDSCSSGSLMRSKGGTPRPPFLSDVSTTVTGHAFLTSASDDEAAQESDRLKGSFFTSAFLSALRGAADSNRDSKVTLNEAYQYAFQETLSQTESTAAGPQRPGFDIEMVGRGDLVLTDVRTAGATLIVPPGAGRLFVHLEETLVAELAVPGTRSIELGLVPGQYRIVLVNGETTRSSMVQLAVGARLELRPNQMASVARESTVSRGGSRHVAVNFGFFPPLQTNSLFDGDISNSVQIGYPVAHSTDLDGVAAALALSIVSGTLHGAQLSSGAAIAGSGGGVQLAVGFSWVREDFVGVQAGVGFTKAAHLEGVQLSSGLNVVTRGFEGAQLGLLNVGGGSSVGAQVGLINVGGEVSGAQIGLLNIAARSKGLQLGLLNIAKESDAPIGLLSIGGERIHVTLAATETLPLTVNVKLGARHVYSILALGMSFRQKPTYGWGLGVGWRTSTERWRLATELITQSLHPSSRPTWSSSELLASLRINVGFRFTPWLSVYAGPSLNFMVDFSDDATELKPLIGWTTSSRPGVPSMLYPGLQVGVEL